MWRNNFLNKVFNLNALFHRFSLSGESEPFSEKQSNEERLVRTGCPAHNCGGRCVLVAHIQDGVITRLDADDRPEDAWFAL